MKKLMPSLVVGAAVTWMILVVIDAKFGTDALTGIGWYTVKALLAIVCGAVCGGFVFWSLDRSTH